MNRSFKDYVIMLSVCIALSACSYLSSHTNNHDSKKPSSNQSSHQKQSHSSAASSTATSSKSLRNIGTAKTAQVSSISENSSAASKAQHSRPISTLPAAAPKRTVPRDNTPVVIKKEKLNIVLLAPFASTNKDVGQSLIDAAHLTFEDFDFNKANLTVIDSGTDFSSIKRAITKLQKKQVDIIIGPLYKEQTRAVYDEYASKHNVIMLSFGLDEELLNRHGLFFLDLVPEQQVEAVTQYATSQGYNNMYALLPNTPYGYDISKKLDKSTAKAKINGIFHYEVQESGAAASFNKAVLTIKNNVADLYAKQRSQTTAANLKLALLIPEGGPRLDYVAQEVTLSADRNLIELKKLGTSLWREYEIKDFSGLEGAWIADVPSGMLSAFEKKFQDRFHYAPSRKASMIYDAVALIAGISTETPSGIQINTTDLLNQNGFEGVNGVFKFSPQGFTTRLFAIFEVRQSEFVEIQKASSEF